MDNELRLALLNKEKLELFLSNLEKLLEDTAINEASYTTLKKEYSHNLKLAIIRVEQLKQELNKKLQARTRELDVFKQELANLNARFKVGQLPANAFLKLSKNPERKVTDLENRVAHLTSLINAEQSADISFSEPSGIGNIFMFGSRPSKSSFAFSQITTNPPELTSAPQEINVPSEPLKIPDTTSISG